MMDKELIEVLEPILKPIEDEFGVDLFTFDEALEFYKSDIENYKVLVNQAIETIRNGKEDKELCSEQVAYIEGLKSSFQFVDMIFGGRVEDGF